MSYSLSQTTALKNDYVNYEYKDIFLENDMEKFILEGYEKFGWEIAENLTEDYLNQMPGGPQAYHEKKIFRLKRERKINNRMELTRLQRNFEACLRDIEKLERNKTSKAFSYSLTVGVIGIVCLIALVLLTTASKTSIWLYILLGIPAINGWVFPYFIYKGQMNKDEGNLEEFILRKYEEIDELFEKGSRLLKM